MSTRDNVQIAPADGKLGVLIPGIGAVTTTFIAGVEAIKRGTGDARSARSRSSRPSAWESAPMAARPMIKDFVPLAGLNDLVFGGWDIYEDNAYEAAVNAKVLEPTLLEQVEGAAVGHQADEGGVRPGIRPAHQRSQRKDRRHQDGQGGDADGRHRAVPRNQRRCAATGDDLVRIHRSVPPAGGGAPDAEGLRVRADEERSGDRAQPDLRLRGAEIRSSVRQRRAQSDHRYAGAAGTGARAQHSDLRQGFQDRPDVHEDADRARA